MSDTDFASLGLSKNILKALNSLGYKKPSPIQEQAIPLLLEDYDLLGIAQTGTGKTCAFSLPILEHLYDDGIKAEPKKPRALVLAPTRELAIQIGDSLKGYGMHMPMRHTVIFGGVGQTPQVKALARGVDIVVATPGRLLDLMNQGHLSLADVEYFVLDEADRMLDMGFIHDMRKVIAALPEDRQSLLFSATMPNEIAKLAGDLLFEPKRVEVTPEVVTVDRIDQSVHFLEKADKRDKLQQLVQDKELEKVIVFSRTKHGADRIARHLEKNGVRAAAIHGDKGQGARQKALKAFRDGGVRCLVATDIAARGIDVDGVTHVINFDLPEESESYVHRIGRTARAGRGGIAISLCSPDELGYLRAIEKLIGKRLTIASGMWPENLDEVIAEELKKVKARRGNRGGNRGGGRRRSGGAGQPSGKGKPKASGKPKTGGKPASQGKPKPKNKSGNKGPRRKSSGGGNQGQNRRSNKSKGKR